MAPAATGIEQQYEPPIKKPYDIATQKEAPPSALGYAQVHNGSEAGRMLRMDTLRRRVNTIDTDVCDAGQEDAFFVADMGEVYRQHLRWKMKLKRVKPHYGMF